MLARPALDLNAAAEPGPARSLAIVSIVVASAWLLGCAGLAVAELRSPTPFLAGLGYALAGLLALVGNAVSLVLHAVYWRRFGAPGWVRVLVGLQGGVALATLLWLAYLAQDDHRQAQQQARNDAVRQAIRHDDVRALARAWADCRGSCGQGWLIDAADARAPRAAAFLIAQGETVASQPGAHTRDARTCEGLYLPSLPALGLAVAHDDAEMVRLLFPVSDAGARRRALWSAAQLDRLARLQQLLALGAPLDIRGEILDENNTLLVAAAEGASLGVGRWLIEHQGMPVHATPGPDPYPGTPPLHALARFMFDVTDSPRIQPFMEMLVAHGARIDEPRHDGTTLLQEALRIKDKRAVAALLAAGASPAVLTAPQREQLRTLEAAAARPGRAGKPENCVPVSADAS